jgi:hypothetical protein
MTLSSSSIPSPGPGGTGTYPSTSGGRFRTSFRMRGEGRRQYSTSASSGPSAAIQCREAARLIPVLKQCGTERRPAAEASSETCRATVRPPQWEISNRTEFLGDGYG